MATWTKSELARAGRMPSAWKAPSLKLEGRPFEPTGLEVGALVEWLEDGVTRGGQVWSKGPVLNTFWIATAEQESVLLRAHRDDRLTRER